LLLYAAFCAFLIISRHIELKTETSIKTFIHECKKVADVRLKNKITGKEITLRTGSTQEILKITEKLNSLT
jgi:hypothetical protein